MADEIPYEVTLSANDGEAFAFSLRFDGEDGTPPPLKGKSIWYSVLAGEGSTELSLSEGSGITVNGPEVTFATDHRLHPGRYSHVCRLRNRATDEEIAIFDGTVSISEGP